MCDLSRRYVLLSIMGCAGFAVTVAAVACFLVWLSSDEVSVFGVTLGTSVACGGCLIAAIVGGWAANLLDCRSREFSILPALAAFAVGSLVGALVSEQSGLMTAAAGIAVAVTGILWGRRELRVHRIFRYGLRVTGHVVAATPRQGTDSTVFAVDYTVAFADRSGNSRQAHSHGTFTERSAPQSGETVHIRYLPNDPDTFLIEDALFGCAERRATLGEGT